MDIVHPDAACDHLGKRGLGRDPARVRILREGDRTAGRRRCRTLDGCRSRCPRSRTGSTSPELALAVGAARLASGPSAVADKITTTSPTRPALIRASSRRGVPASSGSVAGTDETRKNDVCRTAANQQQSDTRLRLGQVLEMGPEYDDRGFVSRGPMGHRGAPRDDQHPLRPSRPGDGPTRIRALPRTATHLGNDRAGCGRAHERRCGSARTLKHQRHVDRLQPRHPSDGREATTHVAAKMFGGAG